MATGGCGHGNGSDSSSSSDVSPDRGDLSLMSTRVLNDINTTYNATPLVATPGARVLNDINTTYNATPLGATPGARVLNDINTTYNATPLVATSGVRGGHLSSTVVESRAPVTVTVAPFPSRHLRTGDCEDQTSWSASSPPEDLSYHFTENELGQAVEVKYLSFVANSCDQWSNWPRLARKMNLDGASLTRLEFLYGEHTREFVFQILLTWKRQHPGVRVRDLVRLLSESHLSSGAVELKKLFASIQWGD